MKLIARVRALSVTLRLRRSVARLLQLMHAHGFARLPLHRGLWHSFVRVQEALENPFNTSSVLAAAEYCANVDGRGLDYSMGQQQGGADIARMLDRGIVPMGRKLRSLLRKIVPTQEQVSLPAAPTRERTPAEFQVTAIMDSTHVGDGNYAPLHVGKHVNLAFYFAAELTPIAEPTAPVVEHRGGGEYHIVGTLMWSKGMDAVVRAHDLWFYGRTTTPESLAAGCSVTGTGLLYVDHYKWSDLLCHEPGAPDIFFVLRVGSIQKVTLPKERTSPRTNKGTGVGGALGPNEYGDENIEPLESMVGQSFSTEFYVIRFDPPRLPRDEHVPKSFLPSDSTR